MCVCVCVCAANTVTLACFVLFFCLVFCILKMFIYSEVLKNMNSRVRFVEGEFTAPLYLRFPILKWA